MTLDELSKWTPVITIIVGILAVATVLYRAGRLSEQIERRIGQVEGNIGQLEGNLVRRLDTLNSWASGFSREISTFLGIIVEMLSRRQQLSSEEVALVPKGFANIGAGQVDALLQAEQFSHNPLNAEEISRLEKYYRRLQAGHLLDYDEVQDYNSMVAVLQKERPSDPGIWPLLALGAFLVGLMIGRGEHR